MISTKSSSPSSRPKSPSTSPRRIRGPSISMPKPMSWLSKTSPGTHGSPSGHSHTSSISSVINISEPKLVQEMFGSTGPKRHSPGRYGVLGAGATVVRTPQDALTRMLPYPSAEPPETVKDDDASSYEEDEPQSPPLPPLPLTSISSPNLPLLSELGELLESGRDMSSPTTNTKPLRTRPSTPVTSPNTRPALKSLSTSPASLPAVPALPLNVSPTPPQPDFSPILLSSIPDMLLDLSTLMVTVETTSSTFRTTYSTLTSRPSYLAAYLESLARSAHEKEKSRFRDSLVEDDESFFEEDDGHRLGEPDTPFASLFSAHLASVGLLPQSAGMINIFLDRPSAPYAHILSHLRSPTNSPATLPRAVALGPRHMHTPERIEALLELRDEAKYLGLDELHKLCCDELRQRHQGHVRGASSTNGTSSTQSNPQEHGCESTLQLRVLEAQPQFQSLRTSMATTAVNRDSHASSFEAGSMTRAQTPVSRRSESRSRSQPRSTEKWL
ncbi:hypothetical protein M422DRAFT_238404 [Sphaerobolus stellatus SS14]|nr:hypothetical protein M422DRAFT_238404 [Sphaerobolus stellatus SS14]